MTVRILRKPPVGNVKTDRLKITLAGNHTLKQKTCMLLQAKYYLQHEQNIEFVGGAGELDVLFMLEIVLGLKQHAGFLLECVVAGQRDFQTVGLDVAYRRFPEYPDGHVKTP